MTRDEIKEGLVHCAAYLDVDDCTGCPYRSGDYARNGCEGVLILDAMQLINELEASLKAMQTTVYELTARQ
jgi:hypothetical protein